jgi:hypothetical protein
MLEVHRLKRRRPLVVKGYRLLTAAIIGIGEIVIPDPTDTSTERAWPRGLPRRL